MTSNRNVKLQFLNKLPKVSVEEQGIEKRRESGTKFKIGNLKTFTSSNVSIANLFKNFVRNLTWLN